MRGTLRFKHSHVFPLGIIPAYAGNTASTSLRGMRPSHSTGGSSPRMRGTQNADIVGDRIPRIIPAYAGNTWIGLAARTKTTDHPRVCGEHLALQDRLVQSWGSSPRMRGTHVCKLVFSTCKGIIPAYAGNTFIIHAHRGSYRDHPRVCGEHERTRQLSWNRQGSSPRMRGTLKILWQCPILRRIIPAYAGNTLNIRLRARPPRDHPRVCGEHFRPFGKFCRQLGSSPRMRGTLGGTRAYRVDLGIIPAYAGNTPHILQLRGRRRDHPRVCGEHRSSSSIASVVAGSSPRMRGTPAETSSYSTRSWIIPAYAGNTLRDYSNFVVSKFMSFVFHLV